MNDWFDSAAGNALLAEERRCCRELLPSGYYPRRLQAGGEAPDFLLDLDAGESFFIGEPAAAVAPGAGASVGNGGGGDASDAAMPIHRAIARPHALPFATKTHDLIILPHTLDFCAADHAETILREAHQALTAHGCLLITGFNPFSLWGLAQVTRRLTMRARRRPWSANFHSLGQVQDWLDSLGFEQVGAAWLGYRPPLTRRGWQQRLAFLDHTGARWWPALGAVYVLVGRKREIAMTPQAAARSGWRLWPAGAPTAAASSPAHAAPQRRR